MQWTEILGGTLNIGILACFYTVFGAFVSYLLFNLFDDYNEEWKKQGTLYQVVDVGTELSFVGAISFWLTYIIREYPPIFPIHKILDHEVDAYSSNLFFAFAMFVFLEDLAKKIKHLFETHLRFWFVRIIPEEWSLLKFLFARKTDSQKDTQKEHYTNGLYS
jgi:hypothetical protein